MAKRLLLVDDEPLIIKGLRFSLEQDGYECDSAVDGEEAIAKFEQGRYDLILLDVMLPKLSGTEVCQRIREHSNVPIIMLTAKGEDMDKILGLEYGADDYMTKPFMMSEFLARVRALTRRRSTIGPQVLTYGDLSLDSATYELICGEKRSRLTAKEYQIMELLMENAGRLISTEQIMDRIWGFESASEINVVWVNISYLRRKLKELGSRVVISSHRGIGYTLRDSEPEE